MLQADEISVHFPARRGFLYLSRLNASAIGTEAGLNVDELEDLRLAVNEMVNWLLQDAEGDGTVTITFASTDSGIEIDGLRTADAELPERQIDDLANAVLGATVDDHRVRNEPAGRRLEMRKSPER